MAGLGTAWQGFMKREDVGSYFIDDKGDVWRMVGYSDRPTITMNRAGSSDQLHFGIDSLIAKEFTKMVTARADPDVLIAACKRVLAAINLEWLYQTGQTVRPAQNYPPPGSICGELHEAGIALQRVVEAASIDFPSPPSAQ